MCTETDIIPAGDPLGLGEALCSLLHQAISESVVGMLLGDVDGKVRYANREALNLLQHPIPLEGGPWYAIDPLAIQACPLELPLAPDSSCVESEFSLALKDGTSRWLGLRSIALRGPDGTLMARVGFLCDISNFKRREMEARLLFDGINDAAFVQSISTGAILDVNTRACQLLGYTRAELLAMRVEDFSEGTAPFDQAAALEWVRKAATGSVQVFEWRAKTRQGKVAWVEVNMCRCPAANSDVLLVSVRSIENRKRAEMKLRQMEERFRMASLQTQQLIYDYDFASGVIEWAGAIAAITGDASDAMSSHRVEEWIERVHPDDRATAMSELQQAIHAIHPYQAVYRFRQRNGSYRHIEDRGDFLMDENGKPYRMLGAMTDVTPRIQNEQEIQESHRKARALLDQTFSLAGLLDPSGLLLDVNQTALDFANCRTEDVLGKPFWETPWWTHDPTLQANLRNHVKRSAMGEIVREEVTHRNQKGETRIIDFSMKPIFDEDGHVLYLLPEGRDITDRKRWERELAEREELFRLLFERSGDAQLLLDGHAFVDCNEATLTLFGANDKAAILNIHPAMLSPAVQPDGQESRSKADEMIDLAFQLGSHAFSWTHSQLDGTAFPAEVRLTAIPWKGKRILHTILRDVSERERAEAERRNMEAQLYHTQKLESMGVLAGGIAHDFNNLLMAVLGNLDLAQNQIPQGSQARKHIDASVQAVMNAAELTRQMLAYSGRGRFVVRVQDINEIIRGTSGLLRVSVPKKISLELRLDPAPVLVEVDSAQFQQVLLNLITNASDAIGEREGRVRLTTSILELGPDELPSLQPDQCLMPGVYAMLEVSDTGSGIPEEIRHRIFDPFFTTKFKGRGLGLSAMLGILRGHGAGLQIDSEVDVGTTFRIFFPQAKNITHAAAVVPESPVLSKTGRILLVDDEPAILETLTTALEDWGYRVSVARDGLDALESLWTTEEGVDLVIMDITMPRMDGREACRAMLALKPDLKVILMSGYDELPSMPEELAGQSASFLPKPFLLKELKAMIHKHLDL